MKDNKGLDQLVAYSVAFGPYRDRMYSTYERGFDVDPLLVSKEQSFAKDKILIAAEKLFIRDTTLDKP